MAGKNEYTVFDYLQWRGDLTLQQDPFNEVDNLVLCIIAYINLRKIDRLWSKNPKDAMLIGDVCARLTAADEICIDQALAAVGAAPLALRPFGQLSDGERQKVLIARALAQEPNLLLLDEPTAFLDWPRRVEIMGILRRLARESGRAVLLSTHDLDRPSIFARRRAPPRAGARSPSTA